MTPAGPMEKRVEKIEAKPSLLERVHLPEGIMHALPRAIGRQAGSENAENQKRE